MIRSRKLLFAALTVLSLSVLVGGCVGVKDRFVGMAEREPGLGLEPRLPVEPRPGSSPVLACGLEEVSPKEVGFDEDSLWEDPQIAALREQLERRGLKPILGAMRLLASQSGKLGLLPFGTEAGITFEERAGQLNAVALIKQENGTLNIYSDGREELWALLSQHAVQDLVEQLRKDEAFLAFEKELASQGQQIDTAQSLGATTLEKGLLYLAVGESSGLTLRPMVSYYRIELSASDKGGYRVQGTPLDVCAAGKDDIKALGFPEGTIMHVIGVYEASAEDKLELQVVRPTRDPCLMGLETLACLDTQRWLPRLIEEKSEQSNISTLESFNWALRQEGVEGGVLYVEDVEQATKLLLAGYRDLTLEQIETLLKAANILEASVPQLQGAFGPTCTEQQPTPAQLIAEAVRFLEDLSLTEVRDKWNEAARAIGLNRVLPKVGEFSGQDWFNYQVALFILAVKESVVANLISRYEAIHILSLKLRYVLGQIHSAAESFPYAPELYRARVEAWLDKIVVAARAHSIHDPGNNWSLLDFLRIIDSRGNELAWPSWNNPPLVQGQTIDVVVLRLGFTGHPNGTLLAFLKVDSSRPDGGRFNDPLGGNLDPAQKADRIIQWLNAVYNHISQNALTGAAFYWHGMKIAGWIFMNPQNPAMMQQLINLIQNRPPSGGFQYPFFIAYTADGQPEVVCFGCSTQAEIWAVWMTACQMGGICARSVRVVGSGSGQNLGDNMLFPTPGDPNEIGTVTPSTGSLFFEPRDGGGGGESPNPCDEN